MVTDTIPPPRVPFIVMGGSGGAGGSAPVGLIYGTALHGTRGTPMGKIEAQMLAKSIELQNGYFDRILASKILDSRYDTKEVQWEPAQPGASKPSGMVRYTDITTLGDTEPQTPDQRLRRMLSEDAKAEVQHSPTIITPAPPKRPLLTAAIYAWTWLRVIYRELYGPAHLRRYL